MSIFNALKKIHSVGSPFCTMVVAAAGSSVRMGENKLFLPLCRVPVLTRTLMAIDAADLVDEIIVATREELMEDVAELCSNAGLTKPVKVVKGGESRTASVLAAASECNPATELIAIHDGARPLVRPTMVDELIRSAAKTYAVAPAVPTIDTIKIADGDGKVISTPDRNMLFAIQTPQVFQADILKAALQAALESNLSTTDDSSAVEMIGKEVYLAEGDRENIKITTPIDMLLAEAIIRWREGRA